MSKKLNVKDMSDIPESYQRYLDEIYSITFKKKKGGWVSNKEIADALSVKPASVSGMLEKLKGRGLIQWEQRKSIRLTKQGKEIALVNNLSCQIEHHITEDVKDSLDKFLKEFLSK